MTAQPKPTVGRIVHYWRQGSEGRIASAAMILEVHGDDDVSLAVFECPALKPSQVVYGSTFFGGVNGVTYVRALRAEKPTVAEWTWPERVT